MAGPLQRGHRPREDVEEVVSDVFLSLWEHAGELREGAPKARIAWADYLDNLAAGVDILRMAFDCPVILGGYVGAYMEDQLEELRGRLAYLNRFDRDGGYVRVCRYRTERRRSARR